MPDVHTCIPVLKAGHPSVLFILYFTGVVVGSSLPLRLPQQCSVLYVTGAMDINTQTHANHTDYKNLYTWHYYTWTVQHLHTSK